MTSEPDELGNPPEVLQTEHASSGKGLLELQQPVGIDAGGVDDRSLGDGLHDSEKSTCAVALGSIAAPAVVKGIGPRPAFAVVGSILPLLTLLAYRRLVMIDRSIEPAPELELIERVPMFAPLSVAAKERVAANLVPRTVQAGELVIRAGDSGDCFYIVGDGEFDIDVNGRQAPPARPTTSARSRCCETCRGQRR